MHAKVFDGFNPNSFGHGKRLKTNQFNQVHLYDNIYALGDCALIDGDKSYPDGHPQVAQPAIQQAKNLADNLLKNQGVFITQASNAFFSNRAFWSIDKTMNDVFWNTIAYHRYLPSFWDWWFVASQKWDLKSIDICDKLWCSVFDKDYKIDKTTVEINTLAHPIIIEYYGEWYKKFNL